MAEAAVSLKSITKSYRLGLRKKKVAVSDLTLSVPRGKIFGLLGPNGAGKTTTAKVILGLVRSNSGTGSVLGERLGQREARERIGFLPEGPYFYMFMNPKDLLDFYGRLFGLDRKTREERISQLLDAVGLSENVHLSLDRFSRGMLQRVGIAQALINDPDLVILDEPSSGLDPIGQKELRDLILDLKAKGKTVILSSHQLSEVEKICDYVSVMHWGRTVAEGSLEELLAVEDLVEVTIESPGVEAMNRIRELATSIESIEEKTMVLVKSEHVYDLLNTCREFSCRLDSVLPYRRSLEDLFIKLVKESDHARNNDTGIQRGKGYSA